MKYRRMSIIMMSKLSHNDDNDYTEKRRWVSSFHHEYARGTGGTDQRQPIGLHVALTCGDF